MKFSILQEQIIKLMDTISGVIDMKSPNHMMKHFLLEVIKKEGLFKITATNGILTITARTVAQVEDNGKFLLPARLFYDFAGAVANSRLDFELDQSKKEVMLVQAGRNKSRIHGMKAKEFPKSPSGEGGTVVSLPAGRLKQAITMCLAAAANKDDREILTGVCFELEAERMILVSADGYRLSKYEYSFETPIVLEKTIRCTVPKKSMIMMRKIISGTPDADDIEISFGERHISFDTGSVFFYSALLAGEFPKTDGMIPEIKKPNTLSVKVKDLKDGLKPANSITRGEENKYYKVLATGDKMYLRADGEKGHAKNFVECKIPEQLKTACNQRFLREGVNLFKGEHMEIYAENAKRPIVMRDPELEEFIHVVMPMFVEFDDEEMQIALV